MAEKCFDEEDPMEFVGVCLPAEDESSTVEMAECFAEEFAREGWDRRQLLAMFRSPSYAGPHMAWRQLGKDRVEKIVDKALQMWRPRSVQGSQPSNPANRTILALPVIQE